MMKLIFFFLVSAALPVCAAEIPDYSKLVGTYRGMVFNDTDMDPVVTRFYILPDGRLRGEYVVDDESEQFEGMLSNPLQVDETMFSFEWTDKYGEGDVELEFSNGFNSFNGYWMSGPDSGQLPWSGTKQ